jgi:hypothetical protein
MGALVVRKRQSQCAARRRGAERSACGVLGVRHQARAREEPATEAAIVVAVGRACGAVFRACIRDQAADLAGRCIK